MENARAVEMEKERELYVAAMKGKVTFVQEAQNDEVLLRRTRQNYNLIHIATRYEQIEFIRQGLIRASLPNIYNLLSDQENSNRNTPLHVAAEVGNLDIMRELYEYSRKTVDDHDEGDRRKQPWLLKNSVGNTAVHVSLIHGNVIVARFLLDKDIELAYIVNNAKEAPLHIAIKQHVNYSESASIMAKLQQPIDKGGVALAIGSASEEIMSRLIEFLVKNHSSVTSWADRDGMTPLHRAASLCTPYHLEITKLIIKHWPQSADVCDPSGKSILHLLLNQKIPSYREGRNLLSHEEIYALRNHQDKDGNTPLHIAVKNKDTIMIRVLLESPAKTNINNKDGISAMPLIHEENFIQMLRHRNMTKDESDAADNANIKYLQERLTKLGIDFLLSKDCDGKNVLHRLMKIRNEIHVNRVEFIDFVKDILDKFPVLVSQRDQTGNTPVHILVQNGYDTHIYFEPDIPNKTQHINDELPSLGQSGFLSELLWICNDKCTRISEQEAPWLVQNREGNTPLHESIISGHKALALQLLEYNEKSADLVNKRCETPLHLLARAPEIEPYDRGDVDKMVKANQEAAQLRDEEGLTPILRAFKAGNLVTATTLCRLCPEAAKIGDSDGRIFWHLLIKQSSSSFLVYRLLQDKKLRSQLETKNIYGVTPLHLAFKIARFEIVKCILEFWKTERENESKNGPSRLTQPDESSLFCQLSLQDENRDTPLHLAIKHSHWEIVQDFIDTWKTERENESKLSRWEIVQVILAFWKTERVNEGLGDHRMWLLKLLDIQNNDGDTPAHLIAESRSLPRQIEKILASDHRFRGVRSSWGIPRSELQTYMNYMIVIAALQTTITFTAAFTVPGGLIQDKGTPILIRSKAFQAFMIFDIIAMCLSMMVLIFPLWMMASKDKRKSVMIQDFAVSLLLASFLETLLAFMTGVYATINPVKPQIAIATLVLCSFLMLLVHNDIVTKLLLPFANLGPAFTKVVKKFLLDNDESMGENGFQNLQAPAFV